LENRTIPHKQQRETSSLAETTLKRSRLASDIAGYDAAAVLTAVDGSTCSYRPHFPLGALTGLGVRQDNIRIVLVDPALQAQVVLRSSFGALVAGMFGMGWIGAGLGTAHLFTPFTIVPFDIFGILLLGYSIYFIRKGRSLRRDYPTSSNARTQRINKQFIVVVILEFTAIAMLSTMAYLFHRPDLAPVLAAIVVGLHFLPLARIFRQTRYYFWGIAITLWCVMCAILFRFNTLIAWSSIGTGVLLWANCAHGLLRVRGIVRSLGR
jgi:hypothetical protein